MAATPQFERLAAIALRAWTSARHGVGSQSFSNEANADRLRPWVVLIVLADGEIDSRTKSSSEAPSRETTMRGRVRPMGYER